MTVTVPAGNSDDRQCFTAGRFPLPLPDKQQVTVLNRSNRTVLPRQLHQKAGVAFIGLVQVIQRHRSNIISYSNLQAVPCGNFLHHFAHRRFVP